MSFQLFAAAHGLQINQLYPADKVQRCATADKPRSKNGAFFWDGFKGWVSDWAQGGELHWFDNPEAKTWTDADRKAWAQRKQNAMQQQSQRWAETRGRAGHRQQVWSTPARWLHRPCGWLEFGKLST